MRRPSSRIQEDRRITRAATEAWRPSWNTFSRPSKGSCLGAMRPPARGAPPGHPALRGSWNSRHDVVFPETASFSNSSFATIGQVKRAQRVLLRDAKLLAILRWLLCAQRRRISDRTGFRLTASKLGPSVSRPIASDLLRYGSAANFAVLRRRQGARAACASSPA